MVRIIDWKTQIKELLIILLAGTIMSIFSCLDCYTHSFKSAATIWSYSVSIWLVLWKGNEILHNLIDRKLTWEDNPIKRLIIGLIVILIFTPSAMYLLMIFFSWMANISFGNVKWTLIISVIITIGISSFITARKFFLAWRELSINAEKLQRESLASKYESLKSQVNPHFLFNSLNALSNLVYQNQDLAVKFIKQLSDVYRYVLDTRTKELVSLQEELEFLNAYLFLQNIRFGDNLKVNNNLNGMLSFVPPLVFQLLIENAIKHNIISSEQPLTIDLNIANGYIIVSNTLQKREVLREESSGFGLDSIKQRYEYLSGKQVLIDERVGRFIVSLPLIMKERV
jgi:LytS/YehU family sensor histidine kinase